jgi:hypothetical protein
MLGKPLSQYEQPGGQAPELVGMSIPRYGKRSVRLDWGKGNDDGE